MKELKVVFTKSKKKLQFLSWLIMLWTWKKYSHVAVEVPMRMLEKPMYFQANEGKVNYEYYDHFHREHEIIKELTIEIPEDIWTELAKKRLMSAGENYGYYQNIGIVLVDIAKLFGIKISNPWKKGQNCSELLWNTVFSKLCPDAGYDPNTIKPHHIEKIILEKF